MALIDRYVRATAGGGGDGSANDDINAWTFAEGVSNYAAGDRVNVIEGTYNLGATITLSISATATGPIVWRGRNSSDTGAGRPYIDMGAGSFTMAGENQLVMDLDVTSTTNGATILLNGDGGFIYRCKAYNTGLGEENFAPHQAVIIADSAMVDCLCVSLSSGPYQEAVTLYRGMITGCKIVTNSRGVRSRNGYRGNIMTNSLIIGDGDREGIFMDGMEFYSAVSSYTNITIYNFSNGIEFEFLPLPSQPSPLVIQNCLFHTCLDTSPSTLTEGYGIRSQDTSETATVSTTHMINNAYYDCSNGFHNVANHDIGTIQCTDDPFSNVSAQDFSLNDLENGGALLRGTVIPLSFSWS